ncbi:hypothetical protein EKK58_10330 [Candidatus Dependentiae bacterium]|nr:MAG: hypothetical protein EKK58_10330 [Candidatus Dependentiae bacterium]
MSKQYKTDAVYKIIKEAKGKDLEQGNLYLMNVPVTFAAVIKATKKYQSEELAWQTNLFVDKETKAKLDDIGINKEFAEVGVTKIKKGTNRGNLKYPLNEHNEAYAGMFAAQFGRDVLNKKGEPRTPIKVVSPDGEAFTKDVGNGSICNIKMYGYRNEDGMLVVMLDTVVVVEHVPYERSEGLHDDILGVTIKTKKDDVAAPAKVDDTDEIDFSDDESSPF